MTGVRSLFGLALLAAALPAQSPLTMVNTSFPPGTAGVAYAQALVATGGTAPYLWSVTGSLPPGIVINPTSSASGSPGLTGTPTSGGTFNFTLSVVDSRGASTSKSFTITIGGSGARLTVTSTTLAAGVVGQAYSQTLTATGGTPPYTWAVDSSTFPTFFTLDPATGAITGTPTTAGTFSFAARATDSTSPTAGTAIATVSVTITAPPLSITTVAPIFSGTVGLAYVQTFRAAGGSPPYNWTVTSGNPGGLTLNSSTGDLTGTPATAGTFNFTVQVADRTSASVSQSFSLVVNPPALTISVSSSLPAGTAGVAYSQKLPVTATGGTPPYTWSASSLPAGLAFDASSLTLSGTPSTAGTFNFTVQATDSSSPTLNASRSLSVVVNPASLSLSTARQLPDGVLNQPYSQTIAAIGGQTPYRWTATGLPTGLTINSSTGQISGTPSAAGNFGVAITVSDNALANASDRFTLNVALPPSPGATLSGLPNTLSPAQQYTMQVGITAPFPAPITGQAILTFAPDSGPADRTIQFSTGGTTASFTIPAGSTAPDTPLSIQTGTVSGTINISLRLQAGGIDITPSPAPTVTGQVNRAAPVIRSVTANRTGSTVNVVVTGYSTAREITQAVFAFSAASGQTLQPSASSITVDVNTLFGTWFQDANNSQFGSVFIFTQPFTVTGDVNAAIPTSVTLTNRVGSATCRPTETGSCSP